MTLLKRLETFGNSWKLRLAVRGLSVVFLAATLLHGSVRSVSLSGDQAAMNHMPGRLASLVGLAADDIKVSGLVHHDSQALLNALNIVPGASLVAFDAGATRRQLEAMDWIEGASVQRKFPNTLEIAVKEREAFAIWQHDGAYKLIDRAGFAFGGLEQMYNAHLPLVTGDGANTSAEELVNQLSVNPELMKKVSAAARVGQRRWNLYLDNGVKVALPEVGVPEALKSVASLDQSDNLLSKGISMVDMRISGQMIVAVAEVEKGAGETASKVSQKQ